MTIAKEGSQFVVRSKTGKKLGSHPTRAAALKQLGAVEASKARRSKSKHARPKGFRRTT